MAAGAFLWGARRLNEWQRTFRQSSGTLAIVTRHHAAVTVNGWLSRIAEAWRGDRGALCYRGSVTARAWSGMRPDALRQFPAGAMTETTHHRRRAAPSAPWVIRITLLVIN